MIEDIFFFLIWWVSFIVMYLITFTFIDNILMRKHEIVMENIKDAHQKEMLEHTFNRIKSDNKCKPH